MYIHSSHCRDSHRIRPSHLLRHETTQPHATRGETSPLSSYFLRVVTAYVLMWMPHLIPCLVRNGNAWAVFGTWGHFQGIVSAAVSLAKPDIYQAWKNFLKCYCYNHVSRQSSSSLFLGGPLNSAREGRERGFWSSLLQRSSSFMVRQSSGSVVVVASGLRQSVPKDAEDCMASSDKPKNYHMIVAPGRL